MGTESKADPLKFAPCPNYGTVLERTLFFSRLVISPDAPPKRLKMRLDTASSCVIGLMNTAASSTYKETLKFTQLASRGLSKPVCCALWKRSCKGSIAKRNIIGDKGSSCLTPRPCRIFLLGSPLSRNEEEEVAQRAETQFLLRRPKHRNSITFRR
jgi:hypothetical protein